MNKDALYILALSKIYGIRRKGVARILDYIKSEGAYMEADICNLLFNLTDKLLRNKRRVKKEEVINAFYFAESILDQSINKGISVVTKYDSDYPALFNDLGESAPLLFYYKGDLKAVTQYPTVAIIGTRNVSPQGNTIGRKYSDQIVDSGFVTVSGLAVGCDTIAHQSSVSKGRPTVAVLPSGLDNIYPYQNIDLAEEILECGGLLLSEYHIGVRPSRAQFFERNRLQVGLSYGTIIIETATKGGTMNTASHTMNSDRLLACLLPNDIDTGFEGNQLLVNKEEALGISNEEELNKILDLLKYRYEKGNAHHLDLDRTIYKQASLF
ncbi:MAG: DNA-processing protein DprA [Hyphomicrobiales bacterium]